MLERIIALLFCFVLGLASLGVAGWLAVSGKVIASVDGLFITLVALLTAVICFGYLGLQVQAALAPESNPKKRR